MGNVDCETVYIHEGELIDETIDSNMIHDSEIDMHIRNAANVKVTVELQIIEGELIGVKATCFLVT